MKALISLLFLFFYADAFSQGLSERLANAFSGMEADPQFKHAISSIMVVDIASGQTIFAKNEELGLAPASCQKLFTSIAGFEMLGHDFRYKTEWAYDGKIEDLSIRGNLHLIGSGDPSFGSWRWASTKEENILAEIISALRQYSIHSITGEIMIDNSRFSTQPIPDGWIWQDIGNYYGAGAWGLNWHENQYDLRLNAGSAAGEETSVNNTDPPQNTLNWQNEIVTGPSGSGDSAYIYAPPYAGFVYTQGSIPPGNAGFTISGSISNPPLYFKDLLEKALVRSGLKVSKGYKIYTGQKAVKQNRPSAQITLYTHLSPSFDSLNYWFLKKSINLYGEAFLKTFALKSNKEGSTPEGVKLLIDFWNRNGIETSSLHIVDGSGLSPQNRVTADALVKALRFAYAKPWYPSFFAALPEINGMKMKSGSIEGARAYAGYQKGPDGKLYAFSIIVNNFDGPGQNVQKKMWQLLDVLK